MTVLTLFADRAGRCYPGRNAGRTRLDCGMYGPVYRTRTAAASGLRTPYIPIQCPHGHWHTHKENQHT